MQVISIHRRDTIINGVEINLFTPASIVHKRPSTEFETVLFHSLSDLSGGGRAWAEHRSEPAFTELVRRHVDFVYSAALRLNWRCPPV